MVVGHYTDCVVGRNVGTCARKYCILLLFVVDKFTDG